MNRWIALTTLTLLLTACGEAPPAAAPQTAEGKAAAAKDEHEGHDHDAEGKGEGEEHGDHEGEGHGDHEEGEPDFAKVDPAKAGEHGIKAEIAAGGPIDEAVTLTGRLIIDPKRVASVRARFPGPVVAVLKEAGESVKRGEVLARIESNESLTTYAVTSPLSGVVLARHTNVGDVATGEALFQVGDVGALQAELQAFTATQATLRVGGSARISIDDQQVQGRIVSVAPELEGRTQARRVRVALTGASSRAVPGQFVTGQLESGVATVATVAVPVDAVRRLEGRDVVFIPEAEGYRARAVKVGRSGLERVEILEGLDVGEEYVSAGAFILKAEIGKNLAEHEH